MLPLIPTMQSQKISVSLPSEMVAFIEYYQVFRGCASRSQVVAEALTLLQSRELENAYREASLEINEDWESTTGDGLTYETW